MRKTQYQKVQEIWLEEVPWIYTANAKVAVAARDTLGNVSADYLHTFGGYGIRGILSRVYVR